jgi:hypothetical protein
MTTSASPNPFEPLVDATRADELDENRTMILDLARSSEDPALMIHVQAVAFADELLFVHEAMAEVHRETGKIQSAKDEANLAEMSRQLALHHLAMLDRHLFSSQN